MTAPVRVGIIGDFDPSSAYHRATCEALAISAQRVGADVDYAWVSTDSLASGSTLVLGAFNGLWASPSSPYRSMEGALDAIRFAREQKRPFVAT